jgi:two-component system sensor histidine kinase CpxA
MWLKKLYPNISVKLFLAFWFAIALSFLASYLVTIQFRSAPIQQQVNTEQLTILNQFKPILEGKRRVQLQKLQLKFNKRHGQFLLIKNLKSNHVSLPRNRGWSKVKNYLASNSLENPITIDFTYTQVTSSTPFVINNTPHQIFVATPLKPGRIVGFIKSLPGVIRLISLLFISFIFCWLLAKTFTKPLIAIQKASKSLGNGELDTRINHYDERSDEFGELARSFNQMAKQLEDNISAHQRLLGDVSHELRAPLTRLQLAVALAEKSMNSPNEQQQHLTRCETEVERLDKMLEEVLTLSRLEHNRSHFAPKIASLNQLIKQVINDCQYLSSTKKIVIHFEDQANVTLNMDRSLLSSAISNVINNAVKYSPLNGVISVSLKLDETVKDNKKQIDDSCAIITVTDNGPGVPDTTLNKLFKPFYRVADNRERATGGTGLGLAIAQQAITLHQGSIEAENIKAENVKAGNIETELNKTKEAKEVGFRVTMTLPIANT